MDFGLARVLTQETLQGMLQRKQTNPSYASQFVADMQVAHIVHSVEQLAKQRGYLASDSHFGEKEKGFVTHNLWELILQGLLVPQQVGGGAGWPFVSFTEYGSKVILGAAPTPYAPDGYLERFLGSDAILRFYVEEALGCFRANRYTATVVMLGVGSERLFDILLDAFLIALASDTERKSLQQRTAGRMLALRYEELMKRLEPKKGGLPVDLGDNLHAFLGVIFDLVRQTRNDAGHPTGRTITRDEAYALLTVFPHYYAQMTDLIAFLQANPKSL